ncbi:MAG TPA: transcriptional regulator [Fimbriimonas sp.]|nr:transcriptional regulator [Fimbriimonas sp.]
MKVEVEPIRTEQDYRIALAELERLWGTPPGSAEGDKLDVLMDMVEAYEREHYPVAPPDPIDAIRFAMDQRGLKPVQLGTILGSTPRVYEVLNGKRKLSLKMIRALHRELDIPLESLIGE